MRKAVRQQITMGHMGTDINTNIRGDFHSHILPEMDDGASSSDISVAMLMSLKQQNMDFVCLTPHYSYHRESIDLFLARRAESYHKLMEALQQKGLEDAVPQIKFAAEVRVETSLMEEPDLHKLCYTGTCALLLELPFNKLENRIYETIENIALKYHIIPVIAHFERYKEFYDREDRERILSLPYVIIQINAETVQSFSERKFVFSLISQGVPVILGSDAHNMTSRPPDIEKAYNKIDAKIKDYERKAFYQTIQDFFCHKTCIK